MMLKHCTKESTSNRVIRVARAAAGGASVAMLCAMYSAQPAGAQLPAECSEFTTPLGIDAGRASQHLRNPDWSTRSKAVRCLAASEQAAGILASVVNDPDPRVKRTALFALGEQQRSSPLFAQLLTDNDSLVRGVAARYAYLSGAAAAQGLAMLAAESKAPLEQRVLALESIERLGPEAASVRTYVAQQLQSNESSLRIAAAKALGRIGSAAHDQSGKLEAQLMQVPKDSLEAAWLKESLVRIDPSRLQVQ